MPESVTNGDDNLGRQWQRLARVGEQALELRHHEGQQDDDRQRRHRQQDDRVDQRRGHRFAQRPRPLQKFGQPAQHRFQRAAGLAGADHVQVETREDALGFQGIGQRCATAHFLLNALQQSLVSLIVSHAEQNGQRPIQRHAGVEQAGQLLGQQHESFWR